jgi:hypothetical protein
VLLRLPIDLFGIDLVASIDLIDSKSVNYGDCTTQDRAVIWFRHVQARPICRQIKPDLHTQFPPYQNVQLIRPISHIGVLHDRVNNSTEVHFTKKGERRETDEPKRKASRLRLGRYS